MFRQGQRRREGQEKRDGIEGICLHSHSPKATPFLAPRTAVCTVAQARALEGTLNSSLPGCTCKQQLQQLSEPPPFPE